MRFITRHALLTYARKHWGRLAQRVVGGLVEAEAHVKQWLAHLWGDHWAAGVFTQIQLAARELTAGNGVSAGRRLRRIVRQEEQRRAATVARHTQPQPARPPAPVPGQRP